MNNAVIFGTFDGVHIGHRSVIENVKRKNVIAITFKIPPKFATKENKNLLMQYEKRERALKKLGVNEICTLDFSDVCNMTAREFLDDVVRKFSPDVMACGYNFRFGKDALGNTEFLEHYCKESGIKFKCSEQVKMYNRAVSSSYIRTLIENGLVCKANTLMAEDFGFCTKVIDGDKRGRTIGFPTINQEYPKDLVIAKFGVYKADILFNNKIYEAITNIGIRPTFKTDTVMAETHIFDFEHDVYGKDIEIHLKNFIREEKEFSNIQELKEAIQKDIKKVSHKK